MTHITPSSEASGPLPIAPTPPTRSRRRQLASRIRRYKLSPLTPTPATELTPSRLRTPSSSSLLSTFSNSSKRSSLFSFSKFRSASSLNDNTPGDVVVGDSPPLDDIIHPEIVPLDVSPPPISPAKNDFGPTITLSPTTSLLSVIHLPDKPPSPSSPLIDSQHKSSPSLTTLASSTLASPSLPSRALSRLRRKTVSILFPQESPEENSNLEPVSPMPIVSTPDSTPATPTLAFDTNTVFSSRRPGSLVRSNSSNVENTSTVDDSKTPVIGNRPRSKTLPTSDGVPTVSNSFPSLPSLTSLISSKFKTEELSLSTPTVFQLRHSPSPVTNLALQSSNTPSTTPSAVSSPIIGTYTPTNPGALATVSIDMGLPERLSNETPEDYLLRIQDLRGSIAARLSTKDDPFFHRTLEIYLLEFDFQGDPIDMALRKLLMSVLLPKETQQIDRILEAFSDRYYQCNQTIFDSAEIVYIVTFSLVILHTDFFNKSNKRKMSKLDFIKNTTVDGVPKEALGCFYDNITYTPFIHTEEDCTVFPPNSTRLSRIRRGSSFRPSTVVVDPYALILEGRLDDIRPSLSPHVLSLEDPYNYLQIPTLGDFLDLRAKFIDGPFLQLVSPRSRPAAFMLDSTTSPNLDQNQPLQNENPGVIDIKVAKVGIVMRSEATKRMMNSKSIWKEWGALLTSSQLYLFKDTSWIKGILAATPKMATTPNTTKPNVHQAPDNSITNTQSSDNNDNSNKGESSPLNASISDNIIRAPMEGFHPTVVIPTNEMVALTTSSSPSTSSLHKFIIVSRGGTQDTFAVTNKADYHEWMSIINYSASFNKFHINILGITGNKGEVHEDQLVDKRHLMDGNGERGRKVEEGRRLPRNLDSKLRRSSSDSSISTNHSPHPASASSLMLSLPCRHNLKFINDFHESRLSLISQKLALLATQLSQQQAQLDIHLQTARHMQILAPIQQRTRESLIFTAGVLSNKIDCLWLERKRNLAYWDVLSREQEVERLICANTSLGGRRLSASTVSVSTVSVSTVSASDQASLLSPSILDDNNDNDDSDADYTMARMDQTDDEKDLDNEEDIPDNNNNDIIPIGLGETTLSSSHNRYSIMSVQESIYYDADAGDPPSPIYENDLTEKLSSSSSHLKQSLTLTTSAKRISMNDRLQNRLSVQNSSSSLSSNFYRLGGDVDNNNTNTIIGASSENSDLTTSTDDTSDVKRSPSLMREYSADFTVKGRKFSLVEVNPNFGSLPNNHKRTMSQTIEEGRKVGR